MGHGMEVVAEAQESGAPPTAQFPEKARSAADRHRAYRLRFSSSCSDSLATYRSRFPSVYATE